MTTTRGGLTRQSLYTRRLFLELPHLMYFNRFGIGLGKTNAGITDTAPMGVITDVSAGAAGKQEGETYDFKFRPILDAGFLPSGQQLDGSENKSSQYADSLTIKEMVMGILNDSILDRLTTDYDLTEGDYQTLLTSAAIALDTEIFTALNTSPTTTIYQESGTLKAHSTHATALAALTTADKFSPELLLKIKPMLTTGFKAKQAPIQPVQVGSEQLWAVVVSPDVEADMKLDSTWHQAMKDAQVKGNDNPIFKNAVARWDQFVIHSHPRVTQGTSATSIPYTVVNILGQNALAQAYAMTPRIDKKNVAYPTQQEGWGFFAVGGFRKIQFNSKDFGCTHLAVANSNYSGITIS